MTHDAVRYQKDAGDANARADAEASKRFGAEIGLIVGGIVTAGIAFLGGWLYGEHQKK